MGPTALFDKSFLQSLNINEAVWFDHFFYPLISPLFFIETLADLEKKPRDGKTAEEEVAIIAEKTPQLSGAPCYFHPGMCVNDLLGNHVPMNGQIPIAGMRTVVKNGKVGAIKDEPEESRAFNRWRRGRFLEMERLHARAWRVSLASVDLSAISKAMKAAGVNSKSCKDLATAFAMADAAVKGLSKSTGRFDGMLEVLQVPHERRRAIKDRWTRLKRPPLDVFAPYAAHILRVEIFFRVGIGASLIADTRASHQVDIAYLFYLPFCKVFISSDRLHRQCAPLFLRPEQKFVWGQDLKADLSDINAIYSRLPDDVKEKGIFKFARRLPDESRGVVRSLYEQYCSYLLQPPFDEEKLNGEQHRKIMEDIKGWETAQEVSADTTTHKGEFDSMILTRSISRQRGSWIQINEDAPKKDEPGVD